jgi:uncharacterized protein with HEPN domain
MRDDRERLRDILEAITRIEKYAVCGEDRFKHDDTIQVWMVHHLQIIGEAARSLSQEARHRAPEIPWSRIIAMRHILVHHYFGIDLREVWNSVEHDLPELKRRIRAMANDLGGVLDG